MRRPPAFADAEVEAVFDAYPPGLRADLLALRRLIFEAAAETAAVGPLVESLKWRQPAYRSTKPNVGTTVRIDAVKGELQYAMFVHCRTTLVSRFRETYPALFTFAGNRAVLFTRGEALPRDELKHCIAMALTYRSR